MKRQNRKVFIKENNMDGILQKGVTLVDFWATWCAPCKMQIPILHELETELRNEKFNVIKVNVDDDMETAALYSIRAIPTLVIFKDGEAVIRLNGIQSKATLLSIIKPYLIS